jgi:hypothetical protein
MGAVDASLLGVAQFHAARPCSGKRLARATRYQRAFLLGQGGIKVQQKRIGIGAQLGHNEGHPLRH